MPDRPAFDPDLAASPLYVAGTSIEEAARASGCTDVLKLASNEAPLGPSPRALAAIRAALESLHRYPPVADDALRAGLARHVGGGIAADQVAAANGAGDVLALIAQGFLAKGDEAVICPPTFPLYEILVRRRGARLVHCPLRPPDYRYDVDGILRAVGPATRLVFLCSPVNPTGTLLRRAEADRLMAGLPERVVAVFDESYRPFVDDPDAADPLPYVRAGRWAVSVRSLSKSHGLAGLRVGYAIGRPELVQYLWRARLPFHMGSLAGVGALAALEDAEHLARTCTLVRTERAWLLGELERRGLAPVPSQANFVLFRPGPPPDEVYRCMLGRGVVVRAAGPFGVPDGVRVTVGTRPQNERFLATLDAALHELAPEVRR